jgi:hypothetical protein
MGVGLKRLTPQNPKPKTQNLKPKGSQRSNEDIKLY